MVDAPEVIYSARALKELARLPGDDRARVRYRLQQYADDPGSSQHDVVALRGREAYRLRVGDWRVVFSKLDGGVIDVLRVAHRREVYR